MANFPDYLYKLTPRDEQVTPLEIVNFNQGQVVTGPAVIQSDYTVPKGMCLLLNSLTIDTTAGAAQTFKSWLILCLSGGVANNAQLLSGEGTLAIAAQRYIQTKQFDHLILGEGTIVRAQMFFSSGAAANLGAFSLFGVLIPRGNFAI